MDLSVVVVTWNAKKYVRECLESLLRQQGAVSIEIIVVDNDSSDGTPDLVRDEFPSVTLIRNDRNLGFAAANNVGIRETKGDYVCLINSDVNVPDGCLERMFRYMEQNSNIGLSGPAMLGPDGTVGRSTMRFPTLWNSFCCAVAVDSLFGGSRFWGGHMMRDFAHDTTMDVDVLNGWFLTARRLALNQVGLLDERFFIYGEDIDWCRRFHQAGWRVVFYAGAAALHYGGQSSANAPVRFYIEMQRANLQYWEKHRGRLATWGFLVNSWVHHLVRVLSYATVYACRASKRGEAAFKVKRSVAAILWLSGVRHAQ